LSLERDVVVVDNKLVWDADDGEQDADEQEEFEEEAEAEEDVAPSGNPVSVKSIICHKY
jgi:hypothetical protein